MRLLLFLLLLSPLRLASQSFVNGDLDGTIFGLTSLPDNWLAVPFTDPVCMATNVNSATPDLTDTAGPVVFLGIMGNPFSGNTFVSGEQALSNTGDFFHEGIRQAVHSLVPGTSYTIRFYQSVVKSSAALDQQGSWSVYADTVLLGITAPTFSAEPFNSISFGWELREVAFFATQVQHQFKFLPTDDDTSHLVGTSLTGALRMGIDSISIYPTPLSSLSDPSSLTCKIYPNPAKESIYFNFGEIHDDIFISVFDLSGKKCYEGAFNGISVIELKPGFQPGIYIVEITSAVGVSRQKILLTQ